MIDALPLLLGPEGYQISRSVRLRSSATAYFNRTPSGAGNLTAWTWSGWVKRGALGGSANILFSASTGGTSPRGILTFTSADTIEFGDNPTGSAWYSLVSTPVYRDPFGWYHIVAVWDSANATSGDRLRLYVNGVRLTAFGIAGYPPINTNSAINTAIAHGVGRYNAGGTLTYCDGYLTEINFIDGQALTPASFGETNPVTGVWQPKKYTGTYGTNGFYLNFSDNSAATAAAIGKDNSGNGNNWTPNNISVTAGVTYDSMLDVPTQWADGGNGRGNYCTLNPLDGTGITANFFLDSANLNLSVNNNSAYRNVRATISPENFKGYFEVVLTTAPNFQLGFAYESILPSSSQYASAGTLYLNYVGDVSNGLTSIKAGCIPTPASGDVIQVAFDFTGGARNVWFGRNGTWGSNSVGVGDPANGTNPVLTVSNIAQSSRLYFAQNSGAGTVTMAANFGQRPFAFSPPTGFKALNTLNLPTPTILKGNQYFDATLYTGTGSAQNIVNSGAMQPDLVWIKDRSFAASSNLLDSVRGPRIHLESNTTNAETTESAGVGLTAFNNNGFSLGTDNAGAGRVNFNGDTFVAWQWKEGPTQGFDIQAITAQASGSASFSHSLGVAPKMFIIKPRTGSFGWAVYHASIGNTQYLTLHSTNAAATNSTLWNNTSPTSTDFTLGSGHAGTGTQIVYLFAEVAGFSKAFSYTGNGSADGPFVHLGFRPRWVMYKRTDAADGWVILDTARDTYNLSVYRVLANSSAAESSSVGFNNMDILSNGFKVRSNSTDQNASGGTYIGFAMAENPFKFSLGR